MLISCHSQFRIVTGTFAPDWLHMFDGSAYELMECARVGLTRACHQIIQMRLAAK